MNKNIGLIAIALMLATVFVNAADAPIQQNIDSVVLYNSAAYISSSAQVSSAKGEVSLKLKIPAEAMDETLLIADNGGTIRQYSIEASDEQKHGITARMLKANYGQKVVLTTNYFSVEGTLTMVVSDSYALLSNATVTMNNSKVSEKQTVFLPLGTVESISVTKTIENLVEEEEYSKYVLLEETANSATRTITMSYFVNGAGWTPVYNMFLGDKTADMQYLTKANNNTQYDWKNIDLTIIAGNPSLPNFYPVYRDYAMKNAAYESAAPMAAGGYADNQYSSYNASEYHQYTLQSRKVTLNKDSTAYIPLLSGKLDFERIYEWQANYGNTVNYKVKFTNTLDEPFAQGWVSVYENGIYAGGTSMPWSAKGDETELTIGTSQDIVVKRTEDTTTAKTPSVTTYTHSVKLHLENHKTKDATVKVKDYLPSDAESFSPSIQPDKTEDNNMEWNVAIAAGKEKDITYTYITRYYVNKGYPVPMTADSSVR
jgi:hypothetical protein